MFVHETQTGAQDSRLENHPSREGCVKLHRGRKKFPHSKDKGMGGGNNQKSKDECACASIANITFTNSLYSLKPLQRKVMRHHHYGKHNKLHENILKPQPLHYPLD